VSSDFEAYLLRVGGLSVGFECRTVLAGAAVARLPVVRVDPLHEEESLESGAGERQGDRRKIKLDNHYTLGGTGSSEAEAMQGSLPVLLHPAPKTVYMLGLGTGITAGGALRHPVERLVVIELLPDAITAARLYLEPQQHGLFDDPRAQILAEDGRTVVASTRERFDLIVGDLFVPWHAGAGGLYMVEHFRAVAAHLNEGGVFMQWLPTYQLSHDEFGVIIHTLLKIFPRITLWRADTSVRTPVLGLLAQNRAEPLDPRAGLRTGRVDAAALGGIRLLTHCLGRLDAMADEFAAFPVNSEDRQVIEFRASMTLRRVKTGAAQWMTGAELTDFLETLAGVSAGALDPHLSAQPERWRHLPEPGLCEYRALMDKHEGYLAEADRHWRCYESLLQAAGL